MARKPKATAGSGWKARLNDLWRTYTGWELMLLAVGHASFIGIIVILFMPIGKGPEVMIPVGPVPAAGTAPFMRAISDFMTVPVDRAPSVETFENGDQYLPAL